MVFRGGGNIKNPNGHGTIYKLSGKRRKPWVAQVTTGWTEDGKQIRQTIGYYATKREGMDALTMHRISPVSPKASITLGELYEEWSRAKYEKIGASTKRNYLVSWSYLSRLEKVPVKDLRAGHIQQAIDAAQTDGKSKSTIEKIKAVAVMLGNYAVQNDVVSKNYAQFTEMPKMEKKKKDRFTDIEVKKIAQVDDPWTDSVMILLYSGMRLNEFLGLTRFNVDIKKRVFTGAGLKTDAGKNRVIPILDEIFPLVERRYSQGNNYLIATEDGKRVNSDWYRKRVYYSILEKAGVSKLSPHCCRHTFASKLSEMGVPPTTIQYILGHASFSTTADNYVHPTTDQLLAAVGNIKY